MRRNKGKEREGMRRGETKIERKMKMKIEKKEEGGTWREKEETKTEKTGDGERREEKIST